MPDQRFPSCPAPVLTGTVFHTCGEAESGKSRCSGSFRVSVFPLIATISLVCIRERQKGTAFCAAEFRSPPTEGAPVDGPLQPYVGCRLKYTPS
jgi:hypothetical protein